MNEASSSQHPGCQSNRTTLGQLNIYLGTLADSLGCFPLGNGPCFPCSLPIKCHSIRSLSELVGGGPHPISSSTSMTINIEATPKWNFGEYEFISQFDWPFTPTHRSSKHFSTCTGSVLHYGLT